MSRGLTIAGFMVALTVSTFTLGGMGWYAAAGVSFDTGLQEDVESTNDDLNQPEAEGVGSEQVGFFGIAVGVTRTVSILGTLLVGTHNILQSWGVPWHIAWSVQLMVDFAFGLTLLAIFRGYQMIRG